MTPSGTVDPQVAVLAADMAYADQAQARGAFGRDLPGIGEPILQPRGGTLRKSA
jgi:hypothetical protein